MNDIQSLSNINIIVIVHVTITYNLINDILNFYNIKIKCTLQLCIVR